jgi:hypothetical protein
VQLIYQGSQVDCLSRSPQPRHAQVDFMFHVSYPHSLYTRPSFAKMPGIFAWHDTPKLVHRTRYGHRLPESPSLATSRHFIRLSTSVLWCATRQYSRKAELPANLTL